MRYVYPAIFIPLNEENFKGYGVEFPDLDTATEGLDLYDALYMAADLLSDVLADLEDDGEEIPTPTDIRKLQLEGDAFASLIRADTDWYREYLAELEKMPKNKTEEDDDDHYISEWLTKRIFKQAGISYPYE